MVFCESCVQAVPVNCWISIFDPFILGRVLLVGTTEFDLCVDVHSLAAVVTFENIGIN